MKLVKEKHIENIAGTEIVFEYAIKYKNNGRTKTWSRFVNLEKALPWTKNNFELVRRDLGALKTAKEFL